VAAVIRAASPSWRVPHSCTTTAASNTTRACISRHAAQVAKPFCRQASKRFIPLRSASAASLLAAPRCPEVANLADAAD